MNLLTHDQNPNADNSLAGGLGYKKIKDMPWQLI
jgi:hypothetical protein